MKFTKSATARFEAICRVRQPNREERAAMRKACRQYAYDNDYELVTEDVVAIALGA